jgi:hypothetical protein
MVPGNISRRQPVNLVPGILPVACGRASTLSSRWFSKLEKKVNIHGGLKAGFKSIYGYTSDQNGIRHPLLDEPEANVNETDALFMLGACAAFVSYLINKARSAKLLDEKPG